MPTPLQRGQAPRKILYLDERGAVSPWAIGQDAGSGRGA